MRSTTNMSAVLLTMVVMAVPGAALGQAQNAGAQMKHDGSVEFISGGIGDTERARMRAQAASYNFKVVTATPGGAYVGSADITIVDAQGEMVLSTRTRGPLFYARLPEGRYAVTVRSGDQAEQRTVRVGSGAAPEVIMTLGVPEQNRAGNPAARARIVDEGVSLYDLDPGAAERAKTQVKRYEVYPDGSTRLLGPNEQPGASRDDAEPAAGTIRDEPLEPGTEHAPTPPAAPPY